ncbi:GAF domain-containing protein [Geodermatophilus saharensis]|uniref:GAF domain-containing protein n=1 Tax=Geodermatophilus saharensis TaxID=1137994 RepID=A0A239FKF0_9ACTN|nr:GAF and ANTAR domain-containing protein [Geodermatophilus saharensis]SNS56692.1 GAF domain-containing protein [Geodermatophilus saharensis]
MARSDEQRSREAAEALEHLGQRSLAELSMESLLQSMADLTKRVMPGDPEASVTLLIRNEPRTVVDTGPLALGLDEAQYRRGDGPCLHTARHGVLVEIGDTRVDSRWPDYGRHVTAHGVLGLLAVPLVLAGEEQVAGSLNVYARRADAFDEASRAVATGLAPYAAVAAGTVQAYRKAREAADNLQIALESRAVIEQAKGILIERHGMTADQAFEALATVSMSRNVKVREIAETLVLTGELPPVRSRSRRSADQAVHQRDT